MGEWIECGAVGPGWSYDGQQFAPPKEPEPAAGSRKILAGAFRLRFNFKERVAIERACVIDPAASADVQQAQATVKTFYADLLSQRTLDLDSAGVARGCALLDSLHLLEADWHDRIIKPDATNQELA
jgi:hypothetical protein